MQITIDEYIHALEAKVGSLAVTNELLLKKINEKEQEEAPKEDSFDGV